MAFLLPSLLPLASKISIEIPHDTLDTIRDTFLFQGEWGLYAYYFALIGFCLANAKAIVAASPTINFWHGVVLQVMTSYGGSTVCAILCGKPVAFFTNESLVAVITFCVLFYMKSAVLAFMNSFLGSILVSIGEKAIE
ncbi:MAG: hypothetical protein SGPRY_013036 [Prymnesium sp.]